MLDTRDLLRRRLWQLQSAYWERRFGVQTRGHVPTAVSSGDLHDYSSLPYAAVFAILYALALRGDDVFMDLGSGKGRVLCCAARRSLGLVVGVEYSDQLCQVARENAANLRGRRTAVRVDCGPAEEADFSGATVLFLCNPFGAETLRLVLDHLGRSLAADPRSIRIAYVNPEQDGELRRCGFAPRSVGPRCAQVRPPRRHLLGARRVEGC